MYNSNDVYRGQEINREMEAGPECEGAMGVAKQTGSSQKMTSGGASGIRSSCFPGLQMSWMTLSSEPQPGVHFSCQIHKFNIATVALDLNAQGMLKCSYMFAHRCSPSICLKYCGEV